MWGIAAAVVGTVVSAVASSSAASKQSDAIGDASKLSSDATIAAQQIQKQMYDQTRQDQTPWRTTGQNALQQLSYGMGLPTRNSSGTVLTDADIRAKLLGQYTSQKTIPGNKA